MREHDSKPRNKLIAQVFYLAGFIENWGRGYEKIRNDFAKDNLTPPTFEEIRGGIQATVKRERFMAMQVITHDNNCIKNDVDNQNDNANVTQNVTQKGDKSSVRIKEVLTVIMSNPDINIDDVANHFGVTVRTVRRDLTKLRESYRIAWIGSAKTGHWEVEPLPKNPQNH